MREFERGVTGMERSDTLHLMEFSLTFNEYRVKICRDFVARNATKLWTLKPVRLYCISLKKSMLHTALSNKSFPMH